MNKSAPVISVVLPVYNCATYIAEAVESILSQLFRDFEFIVIDDGSTDETLQILRGYERKDSRIKLFSRPNKGLVASLNEGIELARGEWIARMDADDISLPHRFERQLQWLETTGADITGSWLQYFGASDKRTVKTPETDSANKMQLLFEVPFGHPTVVMRTTLVKQLGCYKAVGTHENTDLCEDYDLWERAARAGWKMTNVQEVLLMYRQHASQISTSKVMQQQFFGKEVQRRYWEFIFHSMRLNPKWIVEAMKIFDPSCPEIDMDVVDASFTGLLSHSHGESRDVIFNHATRLYIKVAAGCPNIVSRWGKLNREFGEGWGGTTKFNLWLFRWLRIRADDDLFKQLKKLYVWRASR